MENTTTNYPTQPSVPDELNEKKKGLAEEGRKLISNFFKIQMDYDLFGAKLADIYTRYLRNISYGGKHTFPKNISLISAFLGEAIMRDRNKGKWVKNSGLSFVELFPDQIISPWDQVDGRLNGKSNPLTLFFLSPESYSKPPERINELKWFYRGKKQPSAN